MRAQFRHLVETTWNGRADPASVAYRLVRTFRANVSRLVFAALTAPATRAESVSITDTRAEIGRAVGNSSLSGLRTL